MKNIPKIGLLILLFISVLTLDGFSQNNKIELEREDLDTIRVFTSLEAALKQPDQVLRLRLKKERIKEIPKEILALKNLKDLDLSENKIKEIPSWLSELKQLERLHLGDNKIKEIPAHIKAFTNLKRLRLGDNNLDSLVPEISQLKNLVYLDIWANPISYFPKSLSTMTSLKFVDLRVVMLNPEEQQFIINEVFPEAKVVMDRPCDCNRNLLKQNKEEDSPE